MAIMTAFIHACPPSLSLPLFVVKWSVGQWHQAIPRPVSLLSLSRVFCAKLYYVVLGASVANVKVGFAFET